MLIPDLLFVFILQNRNASCFSYINIISVRKKREWQKKTPEEKAKFSAMRSRVQKKVFQKRTKAQKKAFFKKTSESKQKFWDNISEEDKTAHVQKMSAGMQKAWDEADENFGSKVAHAKNIKKLNGDFIIEDDIPRINDYAGVITSSEMTVL